MQLPRSVALSPRGKGTHLVSVTWSLTVSHQRRVGDGGGVGGRVHRALEGASVQHPGKRGSGTAC